MRNVTVKFNEIYIKGTKKVKCHKCGKQSQSTQKFWQTESPFNKDKDGKPKTYSDIWNEIVAEKNEWMAKPLECSKC